MTNEIILRKLIAAYCFVPFDQISMIEKIKDKYVTAAFKQNFANDVCHKWQVINCTAFHNDLFVTYETGNSILDLIKSLS